MKGGKGGDGGCGGQGGHPGTIVISALQDTANFVNFAIFNSSGCYLMWFELNLITFQFNKFQSICCSNSIPVHNMQRKSFSPTRECFFLKCEMPQ